MVCRNMKKIFTMLFGLCFSLCCFAEENNEIKFSVYQNNEYKYAVNEKMLLFYDDIGIKIDSTKGIFFFKEDYSDKSDSVRDREFARMEFSFFPVLSFYPDRGYYALFSYGDNSPEFSIPEIIGEIYLEESFINEILANNFYWKCIRENYNEDIIWTSKERFVEYILPNLNKSQLRILRNTIYAFYGYRFSSKDLQELFTKCSVFGIKWYQPIDNFDESVIVKPHREFINLIKDFEGNK